MNLVIAIIGAAIGILWRAAVLLVVVAALGAAITIVLSPFFSW